ncbi:SpoIIE family protein phosphatase [Kitasatospora sp. NBC_00240]|uniref:SpoIIE family protein phosphatase n=1 Tax=Kitasatospora sp. NBC_00240 TaxID=2903567 RepID=UPI00225852D6|nr:SpoIIE family protein phosphatase [Kitasatospora sp. NBC_00240]MCX5214759.1 SpoIIE family protein phosphatase [Kitasatospora sp. NBC_00240]
MSASTGDSVVLADVAAALVDARGVVVWWSPEAADLLGRPATEVCGRSLLRLVADRRVPTGDDSTGGDRTSAGTARLVDGSGGTVTVAYRVLPVGPPTRYLILAVAADRAADAQQGAAVLRALLGQERIGFVLRDASLAVVRSNLGSLSFEGMSFLAGSRLGDVMRAQDATEVEATLQELLETGEPVVAREQRARPAGGPGAEWALSVSAVRTEDVRGRPAGVAVLFTNATAQFEAARRLELRHRASTAIGRSLDVGRSAQEIADVLVPAFGDLAWVDLAEAVLVGDEPARILGAGDLHLRRIAVRPAHGEWPAALFQVGAAIPAFPDSPLIRRFQQGRAIVVDRATLESSLGDPAFIRAAAPEQGHSLLLAPLYARGLVLGAAAVWRTEHPEPFDRRDTDLLSEIAAHAALAIDNARRYTREHRAATALQQRLLPRATTRTSTLETAGHYLPAAGGAGIGGDWFDVIALPSLRTALVVGDVTGHGLHATATMGRLRTAVQTLADLELSPDELLTQLDGLVARLTAEADPAHRDTVGATCLVMIYDPVAGRCTLASAGHPPPLLLAPHGTAEPVPMRPGPPLGIGGLPFEPSTVELRPDSLIALYTDGLTQRYDGDVDRIADRLTGLGGAGRTLNSVGGSLVAQGAHLPARDDTVLLLARTHALPADAVAHWEFPADPAAVADARLAVAGKLAEWKLDELGFATELIVSELVTNAIRYAGGPVGLRLIHDTTLICEVSDPSNTQPRLRRALTTDEGGRGLFLVAQLSTRWGSRYGLSGKTIWAEQTLQP